MSKIITLQELATKLNGKFWSKEGKERVYLERGYNTKKMSTSTYVEQSENGLFIVKCFVKCDNQDYNWCKSQSDIVIESVEREIEKAATENTTKKMFAIFNTETNLYVNECKFERELSELDEDDVYTNSKKAQNFIDDELFDNNYIVVEIDFNL